MEVRSEGYGPHRYPVLTVAYPYVDGRFYAHHRTPTGETGAYLGERPEPGLHNVCYGTPTFPCLSQPVTRRAARGQAKREAADAKGLIGRRTTGCCRTLCR